MTRGIGTALLVEIMGRCKAAGCGLQAEFVKTERNRIMMVTYRFAGFRIARRDGELTVLEHNLEALPRAPGHVTLLERIDRKML